MLDKVARREGSEFDFELLGQKALGSRVGVRWEEYLEGGELRFELVGKGGFVTAMVACDGRICCGSNGIRCRVGTGPRWSTSGQCG